MAGGHILFNQVQEAAWVPTQTGLGATSSAGMVSCWA